MSSTSENNQLFHVIINDNDEIVISYDDDNREESIVVCEEEYQQLEDYYEIDENEQFDVNELSEDNAVVEELVENVINVCEKCDETFPNHSDLQKHIPFCQQNGTEHIFKDEMYAKIKELEKECQQMEDDDKICFCCEENYDSCHSGHIRCSKCPKSFKNSASFQRHVFLLHSDMEQYPCAICNARCSSEEILKIHTDHHHKRGKPFACKKCGKEFTQRYHVLRHAKYSGCASGYGKKEFECNVCTKVFYAVDNLRSHLKTHLGEDARNYQCPYCDKSFYAASTLTIHIRIHTADRPFACDLCQKVFKSNSALRAHRRCHIGEKPNDCTICFHSFTCKEDLNRHVKTHKGLHTCTICGKSFNQSTQLRNHGCPLCEQQFNSKSKLSKHLVADHTSSDIEFQCQQCDDKFTCLASLKRHITRKHTPKALVCPTCVRKFKK